MRRALAPMRGTVWMVESTTKASFGPAPRWMSVSIRSSGRVDWRNQSVAATAAMSRAAMGSPKSRPSWVALKGPMAKMTSVEPG